MSFTFGATVSTLRHQASRLGHSRPRCRQVYNAQRLSALNMVHAAEQCVASLFAAWREVLLTAKSQGLHGMPHVLLHLAQM